MDVRIYFGIRCLKNGVCLLRLAESEDKEGEMGLVDAHSEPVTNECLTCEWTDWLHFRHV